MIFRAITLATFLTPLIAALGCGGGEDVGHSTPTAQIDPEAGSSDALDDVADAASDIVLPPEVVCGDESAWWALGGTLDPSGTPAAFADAVGPLLADPGQHELTLAIRKVQLDGGCGYRITISGSVDGVGGRQTYPAKHPTKSTPVTWYPTWIQTNAPQESGWIKIRDAAGADVWIPLRSLTLRATLANDQCTTLDPAHVDAQIDSSAGETPITTSSGKTTLGALLGDPAGWRLSLTFKAEGIAMPEN